MRRPADIASGIPWWVPLRQPHRSEGVKTPVLGSELTQTGMNPSLDSPRRLADTGGPVRKAVAPLRQSCALTVLTQRGGIWPLCQPFWQVDTLAGESGVIFVAQARRD